MAPVLGLSPSPVHTLIRARTAPLLPTDTTNSTKYQNSLHYIVLSYGITFLQRLQKNFLEERGRTQISL